MLASISVRIRVKACLWILHSSRSTYGLERLGTLPPRIVLFCSTIWNFFNHNTHTILNFNAVLAIWMISPLWLTGILPYYSQVLPTWYLSKSRSRFWINVYKQILELKVFDWILNYSKNNSCGILYCTGMWPVLDWTWVVVEQLQERNFFYIKVWRRNGILK